MGLDTTSLKLRLVRIENDGTPAVLITSSIDTQQYYINIFSDLYHDKWPIEKDYKTIKCRMELENVSGKSTLCVYHNFHAKVFAKNLVWIMDFYVQDRLEQHASLKKYWHLIQILFDMNPDYDWIAPDTKTGQSNKRKDHQYSTPAP